MPDRWGLWLTNSSMSNSGAMKEPSGFFAATSVRICALVARDFPTMRRIERFPKNLRPGSVHRRSSAHRSLCGTSVHGRRSEITQTGLW